MSENEEGVIQEREEDASPDIEPVEEKEEDDLEEEIEEDNEERESERIEEREDDMVGKGAAVKKAPASRRTKGKRSKASRKRR